MTESEERDALLARIKQDMIHKALCRINTVKLSLPRAMRHDLDTFIRTHACWHKEAANMMAEELDKELRKE